MFLLILCLSLVVFQRSCLGIRVFEPPAVVRDQAILNTQPRIRINKDDDIQLKEVGKSVKATPSGSDTSKTFTKPIPPGLIVADSSGKRTRSKSQASVPQSLICKVNTICQTTKAGEDCQVCEREKEQCSAQYSDGMEEGCGVYLCSVWKTACSQRRCMSSIICEQRLLSSGLPQLLPLAVSLHTVRAQQFGAVMGYQASNSKHQPRSNSTRPDQQVARDQAANI